MANIIAKVESDNTLTFLTSNHIVQGEHLVTNLIVYDRVERGSNEVSVFNFILPDGTKTRSYLGTYQGQVTYQGNVYYSYSARLDLMVSFNRDSMTSTSLYFTFGKVNQVANTILNSVENQLYVDPSVIMAMDLSAIEDSEYIELSTKMANLESMTASANTTTGEPGTQASVNIVKSIVDDVPNFAFNFAIPKGTKGDTGNKGDTGVGIANIVLNADYSLTITTTDGERYTTRSIRGEKGEKGEKGDTGKNFAFDHIYYSVGAMQQDFDNINVGDFCLINTGNKDEDNGKVYVKSATRLNFLVDMSISAFDTLCLTEIMDFYLGQSYPTTFSGINTNKFNRLPIVDDTIVFFTKNHDSTDTYINFGRITKVLPTTDISVQAHYALKGAAGARGANGTNGVDGVDGVDALGYAKIKSGTPIVGLEDTLNINDTIRVPSVNDRIVIFYKDSTKVYLTKCLVLSIASATATYQVQEFNTLVDMSQVDTSTKQDSVTKRISNWFEKFGFTNPIYLKNLNGESRSDYTTYIQTLILCFLGGTSPVYTATNEDKYIPYDEDSQMYLINAFNGTISSTLNPVFYGINYEKGLYVIADFYGDTISIVERSLYIDFLSSNDFEIVETSTSTQKRLSTLRLKNKEYISVTALYDEEAQSANLTHNGVLPTGTLILLSDIGWSASDFAKLQAIASFVYTDTSTGNKYYSMAIVEQNSEHTAQGMLVMSNVLIERPVLSDAEFDAYMEA